jgi:hypothetical protein
MKTTMGVDQYGQTYHNLGEHPRKALLAKMGRKHASKMYVDRAGKPYHTGYIIAGLWIRVYKVEDWSKAA